MTIFYRVSAQEFLNAGAPLTAIRQSYRKHDVYSEQVVAKTEMLPNADKPGTTSVSDAETRYVSTGSARDNFFYYVPALSEAGEPVTAIKDTDTVKLVWNKTIHDSYVLVTPAG